MNCKNEFLLETKGKDIKCAMLDFQPYRSEEKNRGIYLLPVNFTENDFNNFLKSIDFNYDSGFGTQELFGTIWYKDSTWSEREEYDGSEWWSHKICPKIPDELIK